MHLVIAVWTTSVSIRAPARGATSIAINPGSGDRRQSFNPRPRTGGDKPQRSSRPSLARSFNPRPRTGGDVKATRLTIRPYRFQSAPPHGGRHRTLRGGSRATASVSIRAPARGATPGKSSFSPARFEFQSAPPHGGRPTSAGTPASSTLSFQSAPPHGGRLTIDGMCIGPDRCFNPRPRTGGDGSVDMRPPVTGVTGVSIRAPARGATGMRVPVFVGSQMFQSAPPHGGRRHWPDMPDIANLVPRFQSAPPHGGRLARGRRVAVDV